MKTSKKVIKKKPVKKTSNLKKKALSHSKKAAAKRKVHQDRPLHRKIALHPLTVMVILAAAVFIISWTIRAVADNINVTAMVPAPPLPAGAVILSPKDNSTIKSVPIYVTGTCPTRSYIKLSNNGIFSGVAWCSPNGTFSILTGLFNGQNVLKAQDYNITDSPGPVTQPVNVTYIAPEVVSSPAGGTSHKTYTSQPSNLPPNVPVLFLGGDFHYLTVVRGHLFSWSIKLQGGEPPYKAQINWGDGQSSEMTVNSDPILKIEHIYQIPGYYAVIIRVNDSIGQTTWLQLAALIRYPGSVGVFNPVKSNGSPSSSSTSILQALGNIPAWLKLAWPSLIIVLLMLFSFWLGEKEQVQVFYRKRPRYH